LNRTYEPGEHRQGLYATLALVAALVALSVLMLAVLPRGSGAPIPGLDSQRRAGGGEGGSQEEGIAPAPADRSFLCDPFADYEQTSVPTTEKEAAEAVAEEFIRSAYGYTGTNAGAYEERIKGRVVEDCFWESEAGEEIDASEEIVRQGGEANAPDDQYYFEGFVGYYVNGEERVHSESGAEYRVPARLRARGMGLPQGADRSGQSVSPCRLSARADAHQESRRRRVEGNLWRVSFGLPLLRV
jgi:hypothetical protein